jgi:hypothetical protein
MRYPPEILDGDSDDGTIVANVAELADLVVGKRIVKVEKDAQVENDWGGHDIATRITLSNKRSVYLVDTDDCCAFTQLEKFLLHPELVDHVIVGVGTTDGYTTWHIYADAGDVLELSVGWSAGNPFYYGYGFTIRVMDAPLEVPKFASVEEADKWLEELG